MLNLLNIKIRQEIIYKIIKIKKKNKEKFYKKESAFNKLRYLACITF